jgi:acyl-CoA reductase-like NAD-dependent aldehyde dehydrogenase
MGEILNTCEKLRYLINFAEGYLQPEKRHIPMMLAHRNCTVEYKPLGVIGAIVPWVRN